MKQVVHWFQLLFFQKLKSNHERRFFIITKFLRRMNDHIYDSCRVFCSLISSYILAKVSSEGYHAN